MTQTSRVISFTARRAEWLAQLRTACLMLDAKTASVVTSVAITQRFPDASADEQKALISVATHMAAEYGLAASVVTEGSWLTARLFRRNHVVSPDASTGEGRRRQGWLARLFRREGRQRDTSPRGDTEETILEPEHAMAGSRGVAR